MTLPVLASFCREFHETLVQREIVPDGVSPSLVLSVSVVRKVLSDEIVNSVQRQSLLLRRLYGHGDECDVAVRGLHMLHFLFSVVRIRLVERDSSSGDGCNWLGGALCIFAHC